ncbi:unnamed protein product [Durusdinium trenchii]|uniref:Uncharacterized protein n=1 Tax=Durusdinium trenchii TaxID=1381693 RepID=A0ABP0P5S1_9DINO
MPLRSPMPLLPPLRREGLEDLLLPSSQGGLSITLRRLESGGIHMEKCKEKWKNPQAGLPRADDPENGAWPAGPVPTPRERESFEPGFARARADQEVPKARAAPTGVGVAHKDWHLPVQRWQQNWQVIPQELFFQVKENKLIFWM